MYIHNTPTKVFIDYDIKNIGELIKSYGFKKVLFVYGGGSIKKIGLYDGIVDSLKSHNISYIEASGVEPNPKVSFVREVLAKNYEFDMILAVGGGSVIDTAKSISLSHKTGIDPWKFSKQEVEPTSSVPVGVVLTLAAAGSEMSNSCVITNEETNEKEGFGSEFNRPLFAIMNPEYTYSVSKYQTACGVVDIMMHTLERYISDEKSMLADEFAIAVLKTVVKNGWVAYNNPTDYEARKQVMLASSFSHNDLTNIGRNWCPRAHLIEHIISGFYDNVTHGAGLAVVWPAYCKYIYKDSKVAPLLARLAYELFDVEKSNDLVSDAYKGIELMEEFFKSMNMPTRLEELGISKADVEKFSLALTKDKTLTITDVVDIDYEAATNIFMLMFD